MNRSTLYWLLQVLGWGSFAFVNVFFASLSEGISPLQTWAFVALAAFYLLSTHAFRLLIKSYDWFRLGIFRLIAQVLVAVGLLAVSNVLAQVLINLVFGTLNPGFDFRALVISVNLFVSFLYYGFWVLLYFVFHFL